MVYPPRGPHVRHGNHHGFLPVHQLHHAADAVAGQAGSPPAVHPEHHPHHVLVIEGPAKIPVHALVPHDRSQEGIPPRGGTADQALGVDHRDLLLALSPQVGRIHPRVVGAVEKTRMLLALGPGERGQHLVPEAHPGGQIQIHHLRGRGQGPGEGAPQLARLHGETGGGFPEHSLVHVFQKPGRHLPGLGGHVLARDHLRRRLVAGDPVQVGLDSQLLQGPGHEHGLAVDPPQIDRGHGMDKERIAGRGQIEIAEAEVVGPRQHRLSRIPDLHHRGPDLLEHAESHPGRSDVEEHALDTIVHGGLVQVLENGVERGVGGGEDPGGETAHRVLEHGAVDGLEEHGVIPDGGTPSVLEIQAAEKEKKKGPGSP